MALNSGKKIVRRNWYLIPMPDKVIDRVNTLGSSQPKLITVTDMHGRLIGDVETPGVGDNSDECEVEFLGVDAELEEDEMKISYMDPEGNFDIPGVDMEGQEALPQVFEINDPNIPQDSSLIVPEVPADLDGPTQVSTPAT